MVTSTTLSSPPLSWSPSYCAAEGSDANVFLYLLMYLSGGAAGEVLTAYGAKVNYLIDQEGQWWRFVTPIFLHVQLPSQFVQPGPLGWLLANMHLLSNMYGLFMLGPYVEKLYGSARFVVFWILTGVAPAIAKIVRAAGLEPDIRVASDGSVGAAVLAMRAIGLSVDDTMLKTIAASMQERSAKPPT